MGIRKQAEAIIISILLCSVIWATASFAEEKDGQEELSLHAQSAVLMDGRSGRVLWEKDGDVIRPMASTTKIMTCILALEAGLDEERVTQVSAAAASQPQVHLGMRKGQRFFTKDLLYSLMLESHNDSAVAIAEAVAGSVPEFAKRMNQKARELGCMDTWFITPNGLDGKETDEMGVERFHSTTAEDLAKILSYCILNSPKAEEFLAITRTSDYSFHDADGKGSYHCRNHNALLSMMEGVMSGKTGFTGGAGYCYTGAVEDDGRVFAIALLGCGWPPHKTYKWADAKTLLAYGKEHYQYRNVYRDVELSPIQVKDGVSENGWVAKDCRIDLAVRTKNSLVQEGTDKKEPESAKENELNVLLGETDQIKIVKKLPKALKAPIEEGEQVGTIEYYLNNVRIASYPILAQGNVQRFSFSWCVSQIERLFFMQNNF